MQDLHPGEQYFTIHLDSSLFLLTVVARLWYSVIIFNFYAPANVVPNTIMQQSCQPTENDSHSQLESAQKRTVRSRVRLPTSSHDTGSGITWDVLGTNPHCSPLCTFCTQRERQKGSALQPCWDCSCLVTLRQCRTCLYMRTHVHTGYSKHVCGPPS